MGKKAYVGVSDKARTVKNIYVGVGGKARKVVKGYVGVNGKARQFWPARNPWDPYAGKKLVFDYDYQPGNSYPRNRPGIIETLRYSLEKTIFYNSKTGYDTYWQKLASKVDEICDYVESLLVPSDNAVIVQTSFSNYNSIYILCYIGSSPATMIPVTGIGNYSAYKQIYYDTTGDGNSRIFTRVSMDSNGNLTKQYETYSRGIGFVMGNYVEVYGQEHNYMNYITNNGVHFEDFNSGDIVANWDFTQSLYDTVEGVVGCRDIIWGDTTIDSSGLHLYQTDGCDLPSWLMRYGNTLEITFGDYTDAGAITWFNRNSAMFGYTQSDGWRLFDSNLVGTRSEPIGNNNNDLFKNAKFKFHYDDRDFISIYRNNSLLYKSSLVKMTALAKTGSPMELCNTMACTIKKIKIFNE